MIEQITKDEFTNMIVKYHYSKVLPKLNKLFLGDRELKAVMSLGWGVRPVHTIRKIFPNLGTADYFEIGKMCIADEMPKNTATKFISRVIKYLKVNEPQIKVLFTWADGMLGKCGYVYQAANFLYGGYIWTDTYFSESGEKIHPRATGVIGGRPSRDYQKNNGWVHFKGKQFRYVYFLTGKKEVELLIQTSPFQWVRGGAKGNDLAWRKDVDGEWKESKPPDYVSSAVGFSKGGLNSIRRNKQGILFPVDA